MEESKSNIVTKSTPTCGQPKEQKQKPRGVVLVNNYRPPEKKNISDFHEAIEERVKSLQLPDFPE